MVGLEGLTLTELEQGVGGWVDKEGVVAWLGDSQGSQIGVKVVAGGAKQTRGGWHTLTEKSNSAMLKKRTHVNKSNAHV